MIRNEKIKIKDEFKVNKESFDGEAALKLVESMLNIKKDNLCLIEYDEDRAIFKVGSVKLMFVDMSEVEENFIVFEIDVISRNNKFDQNYDDFIEFRIELDNQTISPNFVIDGGSSLSFFNSLDDIKKHLIERNIDIATIFMEIE